MPGTEETLFGKGALTMNEQFFDAMVRHQIYLLRYSGTVRNKVNSILNKTESDIQDKITSKLLNNKGLDTAGYRKLQALQEYIKTVRYKAWDEIDEYWYEQAIELAKKEPVLTLAALKTTSPVILDLILPPPGLLKAMVETKPMQGKTLKEWSKNIRQADLSRITDQIKIGMVQGETSSAIARRVVGTAALKGTDGVTQITRNNAEAITRTIINDISNSARSIFYQENSDFFDEELFVATLDSRTTPVCRANDGKKYPLGVGPQPPLHMSCRSLRVAIIGPDALGTRPMRNFTEKQLLREFSDQYGFDVVTDRDMLQYGTKGSFDAYAAKRMRQLTGTTPANVNYQTWLERQSPEMQDDILGKTKGKLFRDGKLPLEKYVDRAGDELTLARLAATEKKAFIDAGLDPEDFLD